MKKDRAIYLEAARRIAENGGHASARDRRLPHGRDVLTHQYRLFYDVI